MIMKKKKRSKWAKRSRWEGDGRKIFWKLKNMRSKNKMNQNEPKVNENNEATHASDQKKSQELELASKQSQIVCPSVEMAPVISTSSWFAGCLAFPAEILAWNPPCVPCGFVDLGRLSSKCRDFRTQRVATVGVCLRVNRKIQKIIGSRKSWCKGIQACQSRARLKSPS